MIAGRLSEKIDIQKLKIIKNDFGEVEAEEWIPVVSTRADVSYKSGGRVDENNELFFGYSVSFGIRYYHKIDEMDRIKWNDKYYRILSIEPDKKLQRKLIHCELIND